MTPKRQAGMFYGHARKLGLPEPVYKYVLRALLDGTAIPVILRGAVKAGAGQNLNPYGVASQVHRLLCWDYNKYPDDYATNPIDASVCNCVDGRQAVRYHEIGESMDQTSNDITSLTKQYMDGLEMRRWADDCYQYGYVLPSHGTKYSKCGQYVIMGCLHDDGQRHSKTVRFSCGRPSCPICYKKAIQHHAVKAAKRLMTGAILRCSSLYKNRCSLIYHHFIVSIHSDNHEQLMTPDGVDRYRQKIFNNMRQIGYRGGVAVYHPWRFDKNSKRFEPHFHIVAAGYVDHEKYLRNNGKRIMLGKMEPHPISEVHRKTGGDIYRKKSHTGSFDELASMMKYLLTHVGLRTPRQPEGGGGGRNYGPAVTYFGDVSNNKFATKNVLSNSSDLALDIIRIGRSLMGKSENLKQLSLQTATCPPRHDIEGGDKRYGSLSDMDIRAIKYNAAKNVPMDKLVTYLWEEIAHTYNAPISEKHEGEDCATNPIDESNRYVVIRSIIHEKYDGSRVRSKFTVIALDPSTVNLCCKCRCSLHAIVRLDGGGIPPPDGDRPEGKQFMYNDAADWTRYQPRDMHHGRGMPYYGEDGAPHWDRGVKSMPEDTSRFPNEYRCILKGEADESFTKCAVSMMRRQDPYIDTDVAEYAVHHYLAGNGIPEGGWKDDILKDLRAEYMQRYHTDMPPGLGSSD